MPLGILKTESGQSTVVLGNSHETSDFTVDDLERWYELHKGQLTDYHTLELYLDNGPAVGSTRTHFINHMMEFACITRLTIHLLYYPPYHSKYNPVERLWARVENYWNGTLLSSVDKIMNTLKNVTWKGITPLVSFIDKTYKGIKLSRRQMHRREEHLIRDPQLPKWDVWIKPSCSMGRLFLQ